MSEPVAPEVDLDQLQLMLDQGLLHSAKSLIVAVVAETRAHRAAKLSNENCCEHGDHPAPAGHRFCSASCEQCEHAGDEGCSGLCAFSQAESAAKLPPVGVVEALAALDELCDLMPTWRVQSQNARGARALATIRSALEACGSTRAPVEPGVVTREHRYRSKAAVAPDLNTTGTEYWIESGDPKALLWGADQKQTLIDTAQALADAEVRGAARATPPDDPTAEVERLHSKTRDLVQQNIAIGKALSETESKLAQYTRSTMPGRKVCVCVDSKHKPLADCPDCAGLGTVPIAPPGEEVAGLLDDIRKLRAASTMAARRSESLVNELRGCAERIEAFILGGER